MSTDNDEILNKVKAWLLPGLGALLGALLNMQVSNAVGELKETRQQMQAMITKSEVANAQVEYLKQQIVDLQVSRKEAGETHNQIDVRLNSLEQRAAIHDQYMSTHK
jgi:chromosome segregation ATPase